MDDNYFANDAESLYAKDIVILDTETTALDSPEVCEITILDKEGNTLLDTLIKPSKPISEGARDIHGITDEMLQDAPKWSEIHSQFLEAVEDKLVVIYNSNFDTKAIWNTMWASGVEAVYFKSECLMELFSEYYGEYNDYFGSYTWQKLTTAAAHFGIETEGAHRAKADCLMTLGVLKGMAGKLEPEPEQKVKNESTKRRKP
jgi:DNA polymerase-3 subunit epsilon